MKNIKNILIVILFVALLIYTFSKPKVVTKTNTITITKDSIHDSIQYVPKPYPIYKYNDTGSYHVKTDTFRIPTDTPSIVAAYIQKIAYSDTLMDNDKAFILLVDTLQYNRIKSRTKRIKIYSYTKTIRIPERSHIFLGLGVGGSRSQFGVTGNVSFLSKRHRLYGASYDILNKSVFVSIQWRIK